MTCSDLVLGLVLGLGGVLLGTLVYSCILLVLGMLVVDFVLWMARS